MVNKFTCKNLQVGEEGKSAQRGNPMGRQGIEPLRTRASLRFSRGGGGRIFKKPSKFLTTFFFVLVQQLIFRALLKHLKDAAMAKLSAPHANFLKNRSKNRFGALFGNVF